MPNSTLSTIVRSGIVVACLLMAGRLTGFVREWFIARAGASEATDMAVVLLTFPDLMVGLLLGGGLSAALVPAFKQMKPGEDTALLLACMRLVGGFFLLVAIVVAIFAPTILGVLAPGLPAHVHAENTTLFRLITVALPLAALSGVVVASLNASGSFAIGASGTLVFNLTVIACLLSINSYGLPTAITIGALLGALLRLAIQSRGLRLHWPAHGINGRKSIDRALIRRFFASFGFMTVLVALPPLARAIASLDDAGALSLFNYAHKLVELPMGVVIGAITTVLLPRLAADFSLRGQATTAQANLAAGIRAVLSISIGIAIPAAVFADTLVQLAFFKAAFSAEQVRTLSTLAAVGFVSLPFQGLLSIYGSAFAASGHTRPLVSTGLTMLIAIAVLAPATRMALGLTGVMLAYAGVYALGTILLSRQIRKHFGSDTFGVALQNAPKTIILPALVGLGMAMFGNHASDGLISRALWATASFTVFAAGAVLCDANLRAALAKSAKRTGK